MNQEIQQNTTENKKPQMYVSWWVILLDFLVAIGFSSLGMFLMEVFPAHILLGLFSFYVSGILLLLGVILLLVISSIFKKGFTHVGAANSVFVGFGLIQLVLDLMTLITGAPISWSFFLSVLVLFAFGILFVIRINHKFQKSGFELGI